VLLVPLFSVTVIERPAMSVRFSVAGVVIAGPTCHAPYDWRRRGHAVDRDGRDRL
jgi:hypothetical protein